MEGTPAALWRPDELRGPTDAEPVWVHRTRLARFGQGGPVGIPGVPQLHVVSGGTQPTEPLPLLTGTSFANYVNELKQQYTYVVLDVPATMAFPDALHVGKFADAAVLYVQRNVSRGGPLLQTRERLESLEIPIFAVFGR